MNTVCKIRIHKSYLMGQNIFHVVFTELYSNFIAKREFDLNQVLLEESFSYSFEQKSSI